MASKYPTVTAKAKTNPATNYPARGIVKAANDNRIGLVELRSSGRAIGLKAVPRLLSRLVPGVGWGLVAYDLYNLYDWYVTEGETGLNSDKYSQADICTSGMGGFESFAFTTNSLSGRICSTASSRAANPYPAPEANKFTIWEVWRRPDTTPGLHDYKLAVRHARLVNDASVPDFVSTSSSSVPVPLHGPVPMQLPTAFEVPDQGTDVWEGPKPGQEPSARPRPNTRPSPAPVPEPFVIPALPFPFVFSPPVTTPSPGNAPRPIVGPDVSIEPDVNGAPKFGNTPNPVTDAPPSGSGKGSSDGSIIEREYKTKMTKRMGMIWAGIGTISEAADFMLAMHDSIPDGEHKLIARASRAQKLEYMATNVEPWLHIDPAEGLQNYINMQIGDWYAALGSKAIRRVNQDMGSTTGLDRLLREHEEAFGPDARPALPELDIDVEDGVIRVTGPIEIEWMYREFVEQRKLDGIW